MKKKKKMKKNNKKMKKKMSNKNYLTELHPDLFFSIIKKLEFPDLWSLYKTNSQINKLIGDTQIFWKKNYLSNYPKIKWSNYWKQSFLAQIFLQETIPILIKLGKIYIGNYGIMEGNKITILGPGQDFWYLNLGCEKIMNNIKKCCESSIKITKEFIKNIQPLLQINVPFDLIVLKFTKDEWH